jgi:hypothetical protein
MTQRLWITAFFCGLTAGLISGCTLTRGHKDDSLVATGDGKPPPDLPDVAPPKTGEDKNDASPRSENRNGIQQTRYSDDRTNSVSGVPADPTDYAKRQPELLKPYFPLAGDAGGERQDAHVVKALRYFLDKRLPEAVVEIECYDRSIQEPLLLLLPWVARFAEGELNQSKPQDVEKFLEQIDGLSRSLISRASLRLGQVRFCQRVHGFGMIEPLPDEYVFQCGSGGRPGEGVYLYVEVNHTAHRPVGPYFETRLAGRLEILDAAGKRVWSDDFPNKPNTSISPRHDYFVIFQFAIPAHLPPGHYSLAVELSDQTWHGGKETPPYRTARRSLPFEVGAGDGNRSATRPTAGIQPVGGGIR